VSPCGKDDKEDVKYAQQVASSECYARKLQCSAIVKCMGKGVAAASGVPKQRACGAKGSPSPGGRRLKGVIGGAACKSITSFPLTEQVLRLYRWPGQSLFSVAFLGGEGRLPPEEVLE
jgi:hypothetical protein